MADDDWAKAVDEQEGNKLSAAVCHRLDLNAGFFVFSITFTVHTFSVQQVRQFITS